MQYLITSDILSFSIHTNNHNLSEILNYTVTVHASCVRECAAFRVWGAEQLRDFYAFNDAAVLQKLSQQQKELAGIEKQKKNRKTEKQKNRRKTEWLIVELNASFQKTIPLFGELIA